MNDFSTAIKQFQENDYDKSITTKKSLNEITKKRINVDKIFVKKLIKLRKKVYNRD